MIERSSQLIERFSDWGNPILIKETRQAMKSRQFVVTFLLLLVVSWLISVYGVVMAGNAIQFGAVAREFFFAYFTVLAVAIFIIIPYGAYRSLLTEREQNTFELLSITSLTPRQVVWGKLLSALIQLFIYYSAIAPFIAFTALLEGFDFAQVVFLLVCSMLLSLYVSMIALMFSTFVEQRHWQTLLSLVLIGGMLWAFFVFLTFMTSVFANMISFDDSNFWWFCALVILIAGSYFLLFQQITTTRLTFESDNRSTPIRLICSGQFFLLWGTMIGYCWATGTTFDLDTAYGLAVMSAFHWIAVGFFVATEKEELSRRVQRVLPRNQFLRLAYAPWMPGSSRGFLYFLLHVVGVWLFFAASTWWAEPPGYAHSPTRLLWQMTAICSYAAIYVGFASLLHRWLMPLSSELKSSHSRVVAVIIFVLGLMVPVIPALFDVIRPSEFSIYYLPNPFMTLDHITRDSGVAESVAPLLLTIAGLIICLNFRAMGRGVLDVVRVSHRAGNEQREEIGREHAALSVEPLPPVS